MKFIDPTGLAEKIGGVEITSMTHITKEHFDIMDKNGYVNKSDTNRQHRLNQRIDNYEAEKYYQGLDDNYFPLDNDGAEIKDISPYILTNLAGVPYTDEKGAALFNGDGIESLQENGWVIEPKDTFHEKDGRPVVKLAHKDGGEQIYDMFTGKLVTDEQYAGTFNVVPPPYPFMGKNWWGHKARDVDTWVWWGGGRNDKSTPEQREQRLMEGIKKPYGSDYRKLVNPPQPLQGDMWMFKMLNPLSVTP